VGESAEDLLAADPELSEVDRFRRMGVSLSRGELAGGTMRPGSVIVPQVFGQRPSQVVLIGDQDRSESSRRRVPVILSQIAFALGACGGRAGRDLDALGGSTKNSASLDTWRWISIIKQPSRQRTTR
jgi:hypothetical protein